MVFGTNLVMLRLRRTGASLLFIAEQVEGGPQTFTMQGLQAQRFRRESDILHALEAGGIGRWSQFPSDDIQATVTRAQLLAMGFRGNY